MTTTPERPALTGTPKQIVWAEAIRRKAIAQTDNLATQIRNAPAKPEGPTGEQVAAVMTEALAAKLADLTTARWWIDEATNARMLGASATPGAYALTQAMREAALAAFPPAEQPSEAQPATEARTASTPTVEPQPNTCRHGVSYADLCDECEA